MMMIRYVLAESVDRTELTLCPSKSFNKETLLSQDVDGRPLRVLMQFDAPTWEQAKSVRDAVFDFGVCDGYAPAPADLLAAAYRSFTRRGDLRMNVARYIRRVGVHGIALLPEDEAVICAEEDADDGLMHRWLVGDIGEAG